MRRHRPRRSAAVAGSRRRHRPAPARPCAGWRPIPRDDPVESPPLRRRTGTPVLLHRSSSRCQVTVRIPEQGHAEYVLAGAMSPPHFPVRPGEMRGDWRFAGLRAGSHSSKGSRSWRSHPARGRTYGFRVFDGTATIAYLSDHHPLALGPGRDGLGARHGAALALANRVDVLIHDAQHTCDEFPGKAYLGHSTVEYAVALADEAQVRQGPALPPRLRASRRRDRRPRRVLRRAAAGGRGCGRRRRSPGSAAEMCLRRETTTPGQRDKRTCTLL